MEMLTEYQLLTLDGTIFYTGTDNLDQVAVAAFKKLAELHQANPDPDSRIAVELLARTIVPSRPDIIREPVRMGYVGWNLRPKI
jgi:hypothetical protein